MGLGGREPGAGGGNLLGTGAFLEVHEPLVGGADAFLGRLEPGLRHLLSRCGIVALLLGAGVGLEQRLEPLQVGVRGGEVVAGAGHVGLRGGDLCLGLPDVLRARSGLEQGEVGRGLIAVGLGPLEREAGVGGVEDGEDLALFDAVALVDLEIEQLPADLGRHLHLGGLDVAGGTDAVGRGLGRAPGGQQGGGERNGNDAGE